MLRRNRGRSPWSIQAIIWGLPFKFFLLIFSSAVILFCFAFTLSRFNTSDSEPSLQDIDIKLTRQFAAFTVHVETGLFIRSFPYFSMIENKFIVDMVVWFMFNPAEITLDTISKFS